MTERRLHSVGAGPIKANPADVARLRVLADEALHTYIVAATDYDLQRAMVVYNRVRTTLDSQLNPGGERPTGDAA